MGKINWHERRLPPLGAIVYDEHDPRHHARLEAVLNHSHCVIKFIETGWKATIPLHRMRMLHPCNTRTGVSGG